MFATLTSKGQITLPKEIRDRLGLDAGSILHFQVLPDNTITARPVKPDARRHPWSACRPPWRGP